MQRLSQWLSLRAIYWLLVFSSLCLVAVPRSAQAQVTCQWALSPDVSADPRKVLSDLLQPAPPFTKGTKMVDYLKSWPVYVSFDETAIHEAGGDLAEWDSGQKFQPRSNQSMLDFLLEILAPFEMTFTFRSNGISITSQQDSSQNQVCIYDITSLLKGMKKASKPTLARSWISLIETTIAGDWESDGGISTIVPITQGDRQILVVNATVVTHLKIQSLFLAFERIEAK